MLRRLEYICLVGSIALIDADRIDLFGGKGSFRLTPFLVLAPLAVFLHFVIIAVERKLFVPITPSIRRQTPYLVLLAVFLFLASVSTIFGLDPERGLMQLGDVMLVSVSSYWFSVRILGDPSREKLILRAVSLGLIVHLVFCIGQTIAWFNGISTQNPTQATSEVEALFALAGSLFWIPRFSGAAVDPNSAGFVLVMYLALLDTFVRKSRYTGVLRFGIALFVLLALSRSAFLCWVAYQVFSLTFWRQVRVWSVVSLLVALALLSSLLWITHKNEIMEAAELWQVADIVSDRLSTSEGSSGGDHVQLIRRGLETWSNSPRTIIAGIGLGGAPRVLGDFFGDYKYANFHCLYVTVLAELGLPAFIVLMIVLGYPLLARAGAAPAIAALAVFNLPYQAHTYPIFWLVLALLWALKPKVRQQPDRATNTP